MGDGGNMTCIFHFFAIKICQLSLFGGRTKKKVIISFRISFNRYMILIRSFPTILYNFKEETNNFEISRY